MATVTLSLEEYHALLSIARMEDPLLSEGAQSRLGDAAMRGMIPKLKPKRKVSKYSKAFGRQLKALKKKHPRSKIGSLMSQAHVKTRKEMK